jgi:hypothetical protein
VGLTAGLDVWGENTLPLPGTPAHLKSLYFVNPIYIQQLRELILPPIQNARVNTQADRHHVRLGSSF